MQRNYWLVKCNHTPETLDRIVSPFRKRGLMLDSVTYKKSDDDLATCYIEFFEDEFNSNRIMKNLIRIIDILDVEIINQ